MGAGRAGTVLLEHEIYQADESGDRPRPECARRNPGSTLRVQRLPAGHCLRNYDITPDGRRFLIRERQNYVPVPVTELNLVRNWFDDSSA